MAESASRIRPVHPVTRDGRNTPQPHSPPKETGRRPDPQPRHPGAAEPTATPAGRLEQTTPLRIHTDGIEPTSNATTAESAIDSPWAEAAGGIDPLSAHILKRTNSLFPTSSQAPRKQPEIPSIQHTAATPLEPQSTKSLADLRDEEPEGARKEKKKGVSFLRRVIGTTKKKDHHEEPVAEKSERVEERPEGADAEVFSQAVDNVGFNPRHPQPPAYIKVRSQGKKEKDFNRLFLAQELQQDPQPELARTGSFSQGKLQKRRRPTRDATWAMEFSTDGKYLAVGGQDKVVRVWATLSSPEERRMHEKDEEADEVQSGENMRLSAPVFRKKPIQSYEGHTSPVLDLSWSKNNFLLSSSMDKTVRLWHVSRPECLCAFKHNDFVTSIQFHPKDDRFFLAGSLDSKLRLWSIPDKSVAFWNQVPDMITAVSFTPDGKTAIAGCVTGLCLFYDTEGLKYQTQMHVRSAHGKNSKGSKITGIQTINIPPTDPNGDVKLLITSNDSRVRLYNYRDKSLEMKFKGNENVSSQIHARFSDDARYVVCGSEDKRVFIWDVFAHGGTTAEQADNRKDRRPVEAFEAHTAATTVSLLAPTRTRQLLSSSEDPLYDICNPPPVTLVSKAELAESRNSPSFAPDEQGGPSPKASMTGSAAAAAAAPVKRADESPAYVSRSAHPDGNIIVTGDATGAIKVFRQDCAHEKRLAWDAASAAGGISRRGFGGSVRSSRRGSNSTQPPGERILSWRQAVPGQRASFDRPASIANGNNGGAGAVGTATPNANANASTNNPTASTRSISPRKSTTTGAGGSRFSLRSSIHNSSPPRPGTPPSATTATNAPQPASSQHNPSTTPGIHLSRPGARSEDAEQARVRDVATQQAAMAARREGDESRGEEEEEEEGEEVGGDERGRGRQGPLQRQSSYEYWSRGAWRDQMIEQLQQPRREVDGLVVPGGGGSRRSSVNSALTSELSSGSLSSAGEDEGEGARHGGRGGRG